MGAVDRHIVFLGPPNSGKGTQAVSLAEDLGIPAISTGEMLREAVAKGTELGQRVEGIMNSGKLVDDALMAEVVRDRLDQDDTAQGFLLDGYPRTASQAETLAQIASEKGTAVGHVVLIDAPEEVLVARARGRQQAEGREDDRDDVVRERLREYQSKTAPLVEFYEGHGLLRRIDGDQTIEAVGKAIRSAIGYEG